MAGFIVDNNVESSVANNPLAQAAVTLNVANGEGANFPSTFPYRLTIWDEDAHQDPTDDSGMEIVECTARSTDALTIARGKEGTGDVAHANGERVALLITAGLFNDATRGVVTKLDTIEDSATADQTGDEILFAAELGANNRSEKYVQVAAYTKIKQIDLVTASDSIAVDWEQKTGPGGGTSLAKVYRNGGAVGAEKSRGETTYGPMTDTIAGWSDGDTLEMWGYNTVGATHKCYIKNMIISTTTRLSGTANDP